MLGIIVVGHGSFAKGVTTTVEMIAGKQDHYIAVDFLDGSSHEDLYQSLEAATKSLSDTDGILIFTDLKGGTPFQQAVMLAMQSENIEVLTGTNIAMLLEGSLMRGAADSARALADTLVATGLAQVERFDAEAFGKPDEEPDDGI